MANNNEWKNGTIGEIFKDERKKRKMSTTELCNVIYEKYGIPISKTKYNDIENDDAECRDFGYKTIGALANFFNLSVDYLLGFSSCRELNQDINKRNVCNFLKYNDETINALLSWSSSNSLKDKKSVVAELLENIDTDLVDAIINYRRDKYMVKRITDIFFNEYCKNNKLKGVNTINDLSVRNKKILQKIINEAIIDYNINIEKSFEKLEIKLKELITAKLKIANSVFMGELITDEDIKWKYIRLFHKHSDKEECDDGIEPKQKKLF